jgi:serine/threonine protein kinase
METTNEGLVGRTLAGTYRVERAIGEGGMGAVYEATDLRLDRRVAVKVLLFEDDAKMVARFEQEARATAKLSSPNIVLVTDFRADPGEPPFLVMELLEGESLRDRMKREPRMPIAAAVRIVLQLLGALRVAHAAGVIHRDIKPANVFLVRTSGTADEIVKLLDFGIAKVRPDAAKLLTTAGSVLGTPAYFSPEQLLGTELDGRTDVHAVGILLFEMLAGRRPFEEKNAVDLTAAILHAAPMSIRALRADVPEALAAAITDALAKERTLRPTAEELSARIAVHARPSEPIGIEPPRLAPLRLAPRASTSRAPWLVLGVFAVTAGGAAALLSNEEAKPLPVASSDASGALEDAATAAGGGGTDAGNAPAGDALEPKDEPSDDDDLDARRTRLYKARVAALRADHEEVRRILEARVRAGGATREEADLVRAACKAARDRECSAAVRELYPVDAGY